MAEEKIAVVTGTTSGIGREIVRGLLERGYTVVAHARSADKAEAELGKLEASQRPRVHRVLANLASRKDVIRAADEIATRFPKIDLLVHNAAAVPKTRAETEGLEECFATNVLAPFILTRRLESSLRAGAPSRVELFWGGGQNNFDVDDLQSKKSPRYDGWKAYCQSKNACALLTGELARRAKKDDGISYFAVLPGMVNTEGMRGLSNFVFSTLLRPMYRTPAEGARTSLWVATEPGLEARSGVVFGSALGSGWRNEAKPGSNASDPALAKRLWAACEELAG